MKSALVFGFMAIVSLPLAARASLITGELNFGGEVTINFGSIAFDDGNVFTIPVDGQTGGFATLAGTDGMIGNITNPPDATGVPLDVPDFITFAAAPNISITLTELLPGIDGAAGCADTPPAAGQVCTPDTPAQSPFNLQNLSASSSTASFSILGTEVDSLTGDTIGITGVFSTQFTMSDGSICSGPCNFQQLLKDVADDVPITTSFAGQIATVPGITFTPEPTAFVELLTGILALGIGLGYRRKSARS